MQSIHRPLSSFFDPPSGAIGISVTAVATALALACAGGNESDSRGDPRPADQADAGATGNKNFLDEAAAAIRGASYISFDYSANGCNDRSILLSAELAAAGIPSTILLVVATEARLHPKPYPGLDWNYHVAPMIVRPGARPFTSDEKFLVLAGGEAVGVLSADAYIVDPALYPERIVAPISEWIDDLTPDDQEGYIAMDDAREALLVPGPALAQEHAEKLSVPARLESMPKLAQFQVTGSCGFLSRDAQELEGEIGADGVESIRREMNEGVAALLDDMLSQDLLREPKPVSPSPCWDL